MKAYCMNCGHPSEYSAVAPEKCEKCGIEFATAKIEFTLHVQPDKDKKARPIKEIIQEQLEGSEFDSYMEGEPEPFSQEEIQNIFLKDVERGINLKDMMAEGAKKQKRVITKKRRSTKRKSS